MHIFEMKTSEACALDPGDLFFFSSFLGVLCSPYVSTCKGICIKQWSPYSLI